ncbi:MAG: hypothetical protein A3B15_02565 [Candidatus Buchananbacteria bacterium RIFCSPLOWO2_01_FULL_45_31]|uniref:TIGR01906 family membrane protein n=1 Tax=Candidatus Buchananbacteria bacterium RIFCSPLOWO2_01_FULL_45_31 TaxID=1797545 RepID=A0A1G1YQ41_9BACT|nr:MAG: hypothetical protein A3B15_02565 [Candidatus Buchananbacteria bacterium RIFCSPLOWO2_01_FULL_45_31]
MKIIKAIIIITLPVIIVLLNLWLLAFDFGWYQSEFAKLGVYQRLEPQKVLAQTGNLFAYLQGKQILTASYYTEREIAHLTDVKNLVTAAKTALTVFAAIFIAALLWLLKKEEAKKTIKFIFWAGVFCFGFYLLKAVFFFFFFDRIFLLFHQLAFINDFWRLDPQTEFLIVIFPPELFADLAKRIIVYSLAGAGLLAAISGLYLLRLKNKTR